MDLAKIAKEENIRYFLISFVAISWIIIGAID